MKMKRRLLCVLLCIVMLCVGLCGCSNADTAVSISSAKLSNGIYAYYLDYVLSYPEQAGLAEGYTESDVKQAVKRLCASHIAISSICAEEGFSLSIIEKSDVAAKVENEWSLFSSYYSKIGVSKQDYTSVVTNNAKKELILESYYGTQGVEPVSNEDVVKAFNEKFVGFKAITGYLTPISQGADSFTEQELAAISAEFESMASQVNSGADINKLNTTYNESQGLSGPSELSIIVIDDADTTYSEGFFSQVKALERGKAGVVKTDDYIYVIQRIDISADSYVSQHKIEVLEHLKSGDLQQMLENWIAEHPKMKTHGSFNSIYRNIVDVRADRTENIKETTTEAEQSTAE